MRPLQKGYVTAEAQRSQRRILYRVTQTHASPFSFLGFSAPSAMHGEARLRGLWRITYYLDC